MNVLFAKLKRAIGMLFVAGLGIDVLSGVVTAYQIGGKTAAAMTIVAGCAFIFFTARKTGIVPARK
jgi:hypothetical protein